MGSPMAWRGARRPGFMSNAGRVDCSAPQPHEAWDTHVMHHLRALGRHIHMPHTSVAWDTVRYTNSKS